MIISVGGQKGDKMEQLVTIIRETLSDDGCLISLKAEKLIRCKDCKHCDKGIDEDGKPFLKCLGWVYGGTSETDFCSHAERRQE